MNFRGINLLVAMLVSTSFSLALLSEPASKFDSVSQFPLNEKKHLKNNWLVYPENCRSVVEKEWSSMSPNFRKLASISGDLEKAFFENPKSQAAVASSPLRCPAICLTKGTPLDSIMKPAEYLVYSGLRDSIKFREYSSTSEAYSDDRSGEVFPLAGLLAIAMNGFI